LAAARASGIDTRDIEPGENAPQSGFAHVKGKPVLFFRTDLEESEKLEIIKEAFHHVDVDNIYLTPAAREHVLPNNHNE